MAQLKLTWDEFCKAALDSLSTRHPAVILATSPENPTLVRHTGYEGECAHDAPHYIYIKLADK